MSAPIIIALDFPDWPTTKRFLAQFPPTEQLFVKVGMELFYQAGPQIITELKQRGYQIFLDLKLYDIPNTVQKAMQVIGQLGVDLTTIHAAGGTAMLRAGLQGLQTGAEMAHVAPPKLLAITQLTSTSEPQMRAEQLVTESLTKSVQNYAVLAQKAGCAGVICSAQELGQLRAVVGPKFLCITPGIRPQTSLADDQKRTVTPAQAAVLGSNGIVVGRPITQASDPIKAYANIKEDWSVRR